uniref:Ig-like domain-containing protein n=1 Tax=Leptobrachium leishanense TaxID=445787 RepID=A0A8C5PLP3_9ANUR
MHKVNILHGRSNFFIYIYIYILLPIESISVKEGDSVTIPCSFSYPREEWEKKTEVSVYWRSGRKASCWNDIFVYNHTENRSHPNFTGRISMVGTPKQLKTASIRIQRVRRSDFLVFCCRVQLNSLNKSERWQSTFGTYLRTNLTLALTLIMTDGNCYPKNNPNLTLNLTLVLTLALTRAKASPNACLSPDLSPQPICLRIIHKSSKY